MSSLHAIVHVHVHAPAHRNRHVHAHAQVHVPTRDVALYSLAVGVEGESASEESEECSLPALGVRGARR